MHIQQLVTLSSFVLLRAFAQGTEQLHGKPISAECLKNFKAVQPLEIDRTLKFRYVAGNVTQPQSLKDRATKASEALQAYQNALAKADSNLAGPLPPADIAALMQTHRATADVESTLDLLSKSEEAGVKAALKDFNDARRVEDAAITLTEKACPADVYDLFRHRAELKMH